MSDIVVMRHGIASSHFIIHFSLDHWWARWRGLEGTRWARAARPGESARGRGGEIEDELAIDEGRRRKGTRASVERVGRDRDRGRESERARSESASAR
jgi:hypothetical protein